LQYLFLDFESFYDDTYSLKKMTPLEYALDPRFEALGCGFVGIGGNVWWVDGPNLPAFFDSIDWSDIWAVSHNALFDMVVLAFRYGKYPARYGDTLAMARNQLAHKLKSLSLEKVCEYYGLPPKMGTVVKMKGIGFEAMRQLPELHAEVKTYGMDDAVKCRLIFGRLLAGGFPPGELDVVDMVVRMAACPQFDLDQIVLADHLARVKADKAQLLAEAGLSADNISSIMSDQQLSIKLWWLGVKELPRKTSPTTGKEAFAFAKTDKAFTALLEHPNPRVQALVAARLGHKSTLEETRTERLLAISRLTSSAPVPLRYSGAHTHRFSGDWKINLQNLPNNSKLRHAFVAPAGKAVLSVDASQIEARINAVLSGQDDLVEDFRSGVDVYSKFAGEDIYHYPVDKTMKAERFVGKTSILSLGYGSSWPVFQNMCRVKSAGTDHPINFKDDEAAQVVGIYRRRFRRIVENWKYAGDSVMLALSQGSRGEASEVAASITGLELGESLVPWGPLVVKKNRIVLPGGNCLYYNDLRQAVDEQGRMQWLFRRADQTVKVYGAKLVENVVQSLAFVHIMEVAIRVWQLTQGMLWPAHQVHDELIYVVDEHHAERVGELVRREMSRPPEWMPTAPLAAEVNIGASYGAVK
jgi:DNA polymerase bacteriophage-type